LAEVLVEPLLQKAEVVHQEGEMVTAVLEVEGLAQLVRVLAVVHLGLAPIQQAGVEGLQGTVLLVLAVLVVLEVLVLLHLLLGLLLLVLEVEEVVAML
jgi:hypothetical protein